MACPLKAPGAIWRCWSSMATTMTHYFLFSHHLSIPNIFSFSLMCGFTSLVAQQAPWQLKFAVLDRLLWWSWKCHEGITRPAMKPWHSEDLHREGGGNDLNLNLPLYFLLFHLAQLWMDCLCDHAAINIILFFLVPLILAWMYFILGSADLCLSQKYSHCFCDGIPLQLNSRALIGWSGEARSGLSEE